MKEDFLVVHPAQQHAFYTAQALNDKGMLRCVITSMYYKRGTLLHFIARFIAPGKRIRLENRRNDLLDDKKVIVLCEYSALLELISQRIERFFKIQGINSKIKYWHQKRFDRAVLRYIKTNSIKRIISYDNYSYGLYNLIERNNIYIEKILDMSAPAQADFMEILNNHRNCLSDTDRTKYEGSTYKKRVENNINEIMLADRLLCASEYTFESVKRIKSNANCVIARYGVDSDIYSFKQPNSFMSSGKLKIVSIGATNLFKGYTYLIKSLNKIDFDVELHCYGLIDKQYIELSSIDNSNCKLVLHGHVPQKVLLKEIINYDIMIFGSLCDGYGFGALEAILSGVPIIISERAGLSDVLKNQIPDVVYNPYDIEQLVDVLKKYDSLENLKMLQEREAKCVENLTWNNYSDLLYSCFYEFE